MQSVHFDNINQMIENISKTIESREYAISLAEVDYERLCKLVTCNIQELQETRNMKFQMEDQLRQSEFRTKEYESCIRDIHAEFRKYEEDMNKIFLLKKEKQKLLDDRYRNISKAILSQAGKMDEYRNKYDRNKLGEELVALSNENKQILEEIEETKRQVEELKKSFDKIPHGSVDSMSGNILALRPSLVEEFQRKKSRNLLQLLKIKEFEGRKKGLMNEIEELEKEESFSKTSQPN